MDRGRAHRRRRSNRRRIPIEQSGFACIVKRHSPVHKKWFRVGDSDGVLSDPGQDDVVILAVTVRIDQMAHGGR